MPDIFKPLSEVKFVEKLVCKKYRVKVPEFLEERWIPDWEAERFASMRANLKEGDTLFDVGAEAGWISAIYAQFVGGGNMVLVEPCAELWPSIKATWEANELGIPRLTACGFFGAENKTWPAFICLAF
jgi:hypothetical protein